MSIDMSQFYQVFFDEASEHLASMEALLLAFDLDAPDADQLNAIFRAAHSIKGGSSTFGFTDMAEVTHILETLLDRIRKNEITLTHDMVDAFLQAGDVLRGLLEAHQNGSVADESASIAIRVKLERLTAEESLQTPIKGTPPNARPSVGLGAGSGVPTGGVNSAPPKVGGGLPTFGVPLAGANNPTGDREQKRENREQSTSGSAVELSPAFVQHTYQIQFANTRTAFPSETHLKNLLEELSNIGKINNQQITADIVALSLITHTSDAKLREIFSFFLEPQQLTIVELGSSSHSDVDQGYGFFAEPEQINNAAAAPAGSTTKVGNPPPTFGGAELTPPDGTSLLTPIKGTPPDTRPSGGLGARSDPSAAPVRGTPVETPLLRSDPSADAQGYGFFSEPEAIKSGVENAQGYGFFIEVENQVPPPAPVLTARQNEIPGRRATDRVAAATEGESSIRVSVRKVDNLVNLVGELVITEAMLAETVSNMDPVLYERLVNGLAQLERNTRDLQESVMSVRMMPISLVFSRFQRVVRDSAVKLNKKVQLKIIGEGTELDKGLIEKISDPLTHLVRNSLDHGIELPVERIAKGKDPQGTITLRAAHQGGSIIIEVSDDGAGLDRERILAKAREKGMPVSDSMSDADVWQMIFAPGFSTAAVVTDVSGRGVGMDVVKRNIESISGRIEITSRHGQGSTMTIRLPLTLAILDGLSIAVGDQIYIVPLSFISESLQPNPSDIKEISGQGEVVHVRGEYLPLIALHKLFNIQPRITNPAEGILVLLEADGKKIALFVDELVGQHQVVIKSLETNYRKVPGVSGATIMGDGRVAMIIDVGALVKLAQQL